jgi:hypothetical protein
VSPFIDGHVLCESNFPYIAFTRAEESEGLGRLAQSLIAPCRSNGKDHLIFTVLVQLLLFLLLIQL